MNRNIPSPLRQQLARGVQKMILDSGLTYLALARRIGVDVNVIFSYMKKNYRLPSLETFAMLCRELGVSADEVLGLRGWNDA